jgi:hemolysin activation/secretion protein
MTAAANYANLFGDFDNLSLQYQSTPQNFSQIKVLAANYAWGALRNGLRPSLSFVENDSNVPAISTLGVLGKGQVYGGRLSFPLTGAPGLPQSQSLTVGIDYKHFLESISVASQTGGPVNNNTPISYTNLSLAYGGSWSSDLVQGSLSVAADFGPRGAPNNSGTFANKRFKGGANYFYTKIDGSLIFRLPQNVLLTLRADGQFAAEPLINNEDFSITGANAVRGYREAESLTDEGYLGSVQLQSPNWQIGTFQILDVFVFFDAGHARAIDTLQGQPAEQTLRSFGGGLNFFPGYFATGSLTWADPLLDGPNTHRGDRRLLFIGRVSF